MNRIIFTCVLLLFKLPLFSQNNLPLIDSMNSLISEYSFYKGMNLNVDIKESQFNINLPIANQKTSLSLSDVECIKQWEVQFNNQTIYVISVYCREGQNLVVDSLNGLVSKSNGTSINFNNDSARTSFSYLFYELVSLYNVILKDQNADFISDSLSYLYRMKCLTSSADYCRYGTETYHNGPLLIQYSNGKPKIEYVLDSGFFEGIQKTWYPNGQLNEKSNYQKGVHTGEQVVYYENGTLSMRSFYVNGLQDGLAESWNESGIKTMEETFKMGILLSSKFWNEKGELIDSITY